MNPGSWFVADNGFGESVLFAPHRKKRPRGEAASCRFCSERVTQGFVDERKTEWGMLRSVANDFPMFSREAEGELYGFQELIVETEKHDEALSSFSEERLKFVLEYYAARVQKAFEDSNIKSVLLFKNEGVRAGATQPHAHAQLYAMSVSGPRLQASKDSEVDSECIFLEDENVVAYVDPKGRFDGESVIRFKQNKLSDGARALALCMKSAVANGHDFNFFLYVGRGQSIEELRFVPRIGEIWAGLELGAGILVNSTDPREQAIQLRELK